MMLVVWLFKTGLVAAAMALAAVALLRWILERFSVLGQEVRKEAKTQAANRRPAEQAEKIRLFFRQADWFHLKPICFCSILSSQTCNGGSRQVVFVRRVSSAAGFVSGVFRQQHLSPTGGLVNGGFELGRFSRKRISCRRDMPVR